MAELRDMLTGLGLAGVRTLLQSGNAIFESGAKSASDLERKLERETEKRFGHQVDYLIRTAAEWTEALAANPFSAEAALHPARVVAMFLKAAPDEDRVAALRAAIAGPEIVRAHGRVLYAYYPIDIGNSKVTMNLIERKLGTRGSARNWNTVVKIAAVLKESAA